MCSTIFYDFQIDGKVFDVFLQIFFSGKPMDFFSIVRDSMFLRINPFAVINFLILFAPDQVAGALIEFMLDFFNLFLQCICSICKFFFLKYIVIIRLSVKSTNAS